MYQGGLLYLIVDIPLKIYHLKPIAQNVKSYIKDINDFWRKGIKLDALPSMPEDIILCTINAVGGLYPNIPHKDGLVGNVESIRCTRR